MLLIRSSSKLERALKKKLTNKLSQIYSMRPLTLVKRPAEMKIRGEIDMITSVNFHPRTNPIAMPPINVDTY